MEEWMIKIPSQESLSRFSGRPGVGFDMNCKMEYWNNGIY
jgi:hypothetical protein